MITLSRRKLLGGLGLLIAAPAIVRVASLMPVKAIDVAVNEHLNFITATQIEELNEASVARLAAYMAQRERFARMVWPEVSKWWSPRLQTQNWQEMFEENHTHQT